MMTTTVDQVSKLYQAIHAIELANVPVYNVERCIPRKDRAAMARKLFKTLGLKGISVTAPNYSMAQAVDVRVPEMPFPGWVGYEKWEHSTYTEMPDDVPAKANSKAQYAASEKVAAILAVAFPNHRSRNDSQTDYYDYCWSTWG